MLTAQIGLIDPNDYWSTARSGGKDGLGSVDVGEIQTASNNTVYDIESRISQYLGRLPYRGEMKLYKRINPFTNADEISIMAYSMAESRSTWIAAGLAALGLGTGLLVGYAIGKRR